MTEHKGLGVPASPPAEEPAAPVEDEARPEMPVEVAQKVIEGPSLAVAVASGAPLPVPNNADRLGGITGKALDKMAEVLGMTREQMLAMTDREFERSVAWAKLQLTASEIALRTQTRVDENKLRMSAVDPWPKLKERLEKAKIEARQLRGELAQDRDGLTDAGGQAD